METKKSLKANLEKNKILYLLIGFVIVLSILFVAFEWTKKVTVYVAGDFDDNAVVIEHVDPTKQDQPLPPPPPPPASGTDAFDKLKIVEGTADTTNRPVVIETGTPRIVPWTKPVEKPDTIFVIVEEKPSFPGGDEALFEYLRNTIIYPQRAIDMNIQGRVVCQFTVNKDGSITDIDVVRSVDPLLDKEAVRVIAAMPKWTPGKQRDKAVRVKYTLPIVFKLH